MLAHNIVNGEIRTVLYRLRQNSRWSDDFELNNGSDEDKEIYKKFSELRNQITEKYIDPTIMDAEVLLAPFIGTLKSQSLTGSIVDSILLAIDQFLRVGVITIKSPNAAKAMSSMIEAVAKCRFETSDRSQDEVVLVHMLDLFRSSVILPIGKVISDNDIWKIFDTVFNSSQEPYYSPVLRRIAERVLTDMTCLLFKQLYRGVLNTEYEKDLESKSPNSVKSSDEILQSNKNSLLQASSSHHLNLNLEESEYLTPVNEEQIVFNNREFNYVSIAAKVLTFLTTRINPSAVGGGLSQEASSDSVLLCIKLMRLAIETAGTTITHIPEILHLISDDIFEHLIKLIQQSTTSYDIATECMRIFTVISTVLRSRMKLQQEVFFQRVIIWGLKNNKGNPKFEELILDTLIDITSDPSFLIDLYVNYDCDSQRQDLLEQLYRALNETVKDNVLSSTIISRLALRIIYAGIKHIDYRCNELQHPTIITDPLMNDTRTHHESATVLWQKKLKKRTLFKGATIFNTDPKLGIKYLQEAGVIPNPATAVDLAHILRFTPGLDKPTIGQYIGKNNEFNIEVLKEYVKTFNVKDISILTALRMFLETFRLPGEAQQIDRIMETFARYAYEQTSDNKYLINPDVTYCLCFSIIMLNTDLHNPNMKPERKMQIKDFIKLNKTYGDFNEGRELPEDFLKNIYISIASEQILTSESSNINNNILRSEQWTDLIRLSLIRENQYLICHKREDFIDDADHKEFQSMYDRDIFSIIYNTVLESSTSLLESSEDRFNLEYSRDGYITCAHIASHYNMNNIMDEILLSLSRTSLLTTEYLDTNKINNPVEYVYRFSIKPSCQLSIVTLFGIVRKLPNDIQKSWTVILKCIIRLYFLGLLPESLFKESEPDFITQDERYKFFTSVVSNTYSQCAKINQNNSLYISKLLPWTSDTIQEDLSIQQYPLTPSIWMDIINGKDLDETLNISEINAKHLNRLACLTSTYTNTKTSESTEDVYTYLENKHKAEHNDPSTPQLPADTLIIDNTKQHSFLTEIAFECISKCRLDIFIENSTNWSGVTLDLFTDAIISLCKVPYQMENKPIEEPLNPTRLVASEISRSFCIQLLTEILIANKERYGIIWAKISAFIQEVIHNSETPSLIIEKIAIMIYRLCIHVIQDEKGEDLLLSLSLLLSIKRDIFISIAPQIASATYHLFVAKGVYISSQGHWGDLQKILDSCANISNTVIYNYQTLQFIFTDPHLQQCIPISFASTLNVFLQTSITSANMVMDILDYALCLHNNVMLLLYNEDPNITWNNSWSPILRTVTIACMDKRQQVRIKALKTLDTMLLDKRTNILTNTEWCAVILHVLYPVLKDILMDIVGVKDNDNAVLRYRVSRIPNNPVISLLLVVMVNVLTYRLESLITNEEFVRIWTQTLSIFQFVESISIKDSILMKENEKLLQFLLIKVDEIGLFNLGDHRYTSEFWRITEGVLDKISPSIKSTFLKSMEDTEESHVNIPDPTIDSIPDTVEDIPSTVSPIQNTTTSSDSTESTSVSPIQTEVTTSKNTESTSVSVEL